jgi:hypothetical protein
MGNAKQMSVSSAQLRIHNFQIKASQSTHFWGAQMNIMRQI